MKNICVVGCGKIGRKHSSKLSKFTNLFFYSRSRSSAAKFNQAFSGKGVFDRFDEVINSSDIDAVVISSPPEEHKEQIVRSLQSGKSVLVEKPMCISEADLIDVENTLRKTNSKTFLMVAENYFYKPSLKMIKQLVKDQYLGEIQSIRVRKVFKQLATGWKSQIGALLEGGIHFISLISDIIDDTPEEIEACFPGFKKGDIERNSITKLIYKNNISAQLTYSWNTNSLSKGTFQHSKIIGDKGIIIFESNGIYFFIRSNKRTGICIPNLADFMGTHAMIKDFLICLDDNQRIPYSNFYRAKRDLGIVFQAYKNLSA